MPINRNSGFLIGSIDGSNVLTPVTIAPLATLDSNTLDVLQSNAAVGSMHLWLYVKRETGAGDNAAVKMRLNSLPVTAVAGQPAGEDYKVKASAWIFDASVPPLDDGYKIIDLGFTDQIARNVSAEVYNGHATDNILVAVRYESEVIS